MDVIDAINEAMAENELRGVTVDESVNEHELLGQEGTQLVSKLYLSSIPCVFKLYHVMAIEFS